MMNVFQKTLKTFKEIPIKLCREIRFSNGGHLFACTNQHAISVYKFYTAECPPEYTFKEHSGKVRCIQWLDDDSGFISGGWDGAVIMWKLHPDQSAGKDGQEKEANPIQRYNLKNVNFSCVANKPDDKKTFYAVGTDKSIKEITDGKERMRYEAGVNISQLVVMHGARAFFAGIAEDDKPGSIQVLRYPWEKVFEVQAHSLPVERLRISFDNQVLFSSGHDGVLCIFDIKDKDPKGKKDKENVQIHLSEEILIPKAERDKYMADIDHLRASIQKLKDENEARMKHTLFTRQQEIERIEAEIDAKKVDFENRKAALENAKREMERMYNEKLRQMRQAHEIELARRE
jgi:WD40 repeat protein